MTEYAQKLKNPAWQKIRLKVFERDAWTCTQCYRTDATLAVHHLYYTAGKEPWEYPLRALRTLCEDCHKEEHFARKTAEDRLLRAMKKAALLTQQVDTLANALEEMEWTDTPASVISALAWWLQNPSLQKHIVDAHQGKNSN